MVLLIPKFLLLFLSFGSRSFFKNSEDSFEDVSDDLKNHVVDDDECIVSFDIVSLYTNVPVHEAIDVCADLLFNNVLISGVDKVRYRRLITPGDTLNINIELVSKKLTLYKFDGTIKIDGQLAVQAKISSNLVDRVEV